MSIMQGRMKKQGILWQRKKKAWWKLEREKTETWVLFGRERQGVSKRERERGTRMAIMPLDLIAMSL